jgi:protein O-GlcNAc transferase
MMVSAESLPPNPSVRASLAQRLAMALAHHQRGELDLAEKSYRSILHESPRNFDALHLLGIATLDRGAVDESIDWMQRALAVDSSRANAHFHLARAWVAKGDTQSAAACLDRALGLQPELPDAWFLRANLLQQSARLEESVDSYERAIRTRPDFPEALNNIAVALRALRRTVLALDHVERALTLQPAYPSALNNRGLILLDLDRLPAAIDCFRQAITANPRFADALHNLGTALMQLGRYEDARDAFVRLAAIAPGFRHVQGNLLHARLSLCDWTDYDTATQAVARAVARGDHADVPMSFLCVSGSAALQRRCAQIYTEAHYPQQATGLQTGLHGRPDRIRVAYLSGDFGAHAVTYLLSGVFERHDRSRFETIALSWGRQRDGAARGRVEAAFSRFIDISAVSDADAAGMMREWGVDIAVDLTGHTRGHRTGILARRAAPVQVNYLGLPATMGADYMDYLIADRFLIPEDQQIQYAEQIVRLPVSYQPNDDRRALVADSRPRGAHDLPNEGMVFCSFNSNFKFNPQTFGVWMRLIRSVPDCVLWLLATSRTAEDNLRREARTRRVDPSRLVFAKRAPYDEYLARYVHADLVLDTLPFNGGTTVSDALSMGVPVLACVGDSFAARMASSLLSSLGLAELVTHSMAQYEAAALDLGTNPLRLRHLRQCLRQRRADHPFFDTDRYRRCLEAAYQTMWERSAAGLPPAPFAVPANDN